MGNKKIDNVLIFNAVPTNNGDAALVFSLYDVFVKKGYNTKIAAMHYDLIKGIYKDKRIVQEIGDASIWKKFRYYGLIKKYSPLFFFWFSKDFRKSDLLVASPGGYINSYYGFTKVSLTFMIAKLFGKKTAIYSQSIGPLNKKGEYRMKQLARYVDLILARDVFSEDVLKKVGISSERYKLTEDAAFLLEYDNSESSVSSKVAAISVRGWKHDGRDNVHFQNMIAEFVKILVDQGYSIEFISTCQGLEGYVDDSKVAQTIYNKLDSKYQEKVVVNDKYYNLDDFRLYIRQFNMVIGTRLHMCILSLIAGIPAFNISYEIKGKEVYKYCGLSKYSIDFNEDIRHGIDSLNKFIKDKEVIRNNLSTIIPQRNQKAQDTFDYLINFFK